jgi:hypothetical protein
MYVADYSTPLHRAFAIRITYQSGAQHEMQLAFEAQPMPIMESLAKAALQQ